MSPAPRRPPAADSPAVAPAPPASAERAALRRTTVALVHAREHDLGAYDGAERRVSDGHPPETPESRERLARTGERRVWVAQDAARAAFARAAGAYARALRAGGLTLRQALAAEAAVVREAAAPSAGRDSLEAIVHDAGRYGVTAFLAR